MNIILKSFLITLAVTLAVMLFALLLYLIELLPEFYGLISLITLLFVLIWSFVYILLK